MTKDRYAELGASATKEGLHAQLKSLGMHDGAGLFATVTKDFAGDPNYYSFLHCDGAGTKSLVAYLMHRETKDTKHFAGLAQDALVMNLDDIYCLGIAENLVLSNAMARNARIISDDAVGAVIGGYKSLVTKLAELGIEVELNGGETADCGDIVRTLVVDAVIAGRIKRSNVINPNNIIAGDVIVGLSSCGKASYEAAPNSGVGSNGLTLARHALLSQKYLSGIPETVDPGADTSHIYTGPFKVTDCPAGLGMSVGEALLSPTRTFAPLLRKIYTELHAEVHAAIHVTGGGLTKVLRFGKGKRYIKDNLLPVPPLFSLIQEHGKVSWQEMYKVFNMGQRFELYLPEKLAATVISRAREYNIDAKIIGYVEDIDDNQSTGNVVSVKSEHGTFEYSL